MKATGIVRKIDDLGRIVLPIELRRVLSITDRDAIEIYTHEDSIVLKKYKPGCVICGSVENLVTVHDTSICAACVAKAGEGLAHG